MLIRSNFLFLSILLLYSFNSFAGSPLDTLKTLPSSSLLLVDENKQVLQTKNAEQLYIPASTIKVLTSLIALDHWGNDYRFKTDFYFDPVTSSLWIKGYGDPYLVSEELDIIVNKVKQEGISELDGIGIDNSYFSKTMTIDGQGNSLNPYDATLGATAANFNTINIRVYENSISSSETQTPLTPLANELAKGLSIGTHRINLGDAEYGPRYFSELLKAKLNLSEIPTDALFQSGRIPSTAVLLFTHQNSKTLEHVISSMLEFSNNFIANQLFLALGAEIHDSPANLEKSQAVVSDYIKNNFNWTDYIIIEGAGLSRQNRMSALQLIDILDKFKAYRHLMPAQTQDIFAKSGTLKNVSTYAGYINRNDSWTPFAIMINQRVSFKFREEVALELLKTL
ncbi:MAG: D-alanyl-D-alanine carboxypeptidase [Gammaproteobacteria bacterium]|nr:D-alanyl-D-alanine carboxypeptidase [Gammaproteobacteria bacterium]